MRGDGGDTTVEGSKVDVLSSLGVSGVRVGEEGSGELDCFSKLGSTGKLVVLCKKLDPAGVRGVTPTIASSGCPNTPCSSAFVDNEHKTVLIFYL